MSNQYDDHELQSQANQTWQALDSGDPLGHAIKDTADLDLPKRDQQLREVLLERLACQPPVSTVGKESKLKTEKKRNRNKWMQWALALGIASLLGVLVWAVQRPMTVAKHMDNTEASEIPIANPPLVNLNPPAMSMGGGGPPSTPEDQRKIKGDNRGSVGIGGGTGSDKLGRGAGTGSASISELERDVNWATAYELGGKADGGVPLNFGDESNASGNGVSSDLAMYFPEHKLNKLENGFSITKEFEFFDRDHLIGHTKDKAYFELPDFERSGEVYNQIYENKFLRTVGDLAVSTFSIDVDTASYANMRRFLKSGQRPPANSVRIEEMINYFHYDYPQPKGDVPFSVNLEVAACPWNDGHQLVRVGLKGKEIHRDQRPVSNLVFLLDVSGSMNNRDKLPLLKRGLRMMIDQLNENDRVSFVTYAGQAGVVLEPTSGDQKKKIHEAIDRLSSGGSTHGSAGIEKAYNLANRNYIEDGTNRVIWATDGDLNVGITDDQTLINLVAERAKEGIFLTTLGFGTGNLKDGKLEQIANNGNGIYAYIDSMQEARKVLVEQMSGSLVTIAKDVKLQLEFNSSEVAAYRLLGYENRMLKTEDFDNDAKDAGDIGAGHTVTALYEIVPAGAVGTESAPRSGTSLKYQQPAAQSGQKEQPATKVAGDFEPTEAAANGELLTLALRYKLPEGSESTRIEFTLKGSDLSFDEASSDFRFASSVAGFGMLLRNSRFRGSINKKMIEGFAANALGHDTNGYRAEFLDLVRQSR